LRVALAGLTWVIYDYFVTLTDEVRYIWSQDQGLAKFMFLWIRYYTIALVAFDTLQIHTFAIPGVPTDRTCVIIAPITRILGAISLWSVEIIMQLRVYALFNSSRRVAFFTGVLFVASMGVYLWLLIVNSMRRAELIAAATHLPLPGCPTINGGTEWALWISPTVFEFILFLFVVYKGFISVAVRIRLNERVTLMAALINENCLYFFSIALLLIFNNLMVIGATKIPWFGFAPFHGAIGIVTCRVLIHLRKFNLTTVLSNGKTNRPLEPLEFAGFGRSTPVSSSATTSTRSVLPLHSVRSVWPQDLGSEPTEIRIIRSERSLLPTHYVAATR